MIQIKENKDCCGCNACVQRCPKQCITMLVDDEGFLYPKVDESRCIDCGLCEKVCPVINQADEFEKPYIYAAQNNNIDILKTSSSGGAFYTLAAHVIKNGGVVFGAKFNSDWEVIHDYTETLEGVKQFQGSKYVQSNIGNSFIKVEEFLKKGRIVLFSGVPCQLRALQLFLRKDYSSQLIKVDLICHGVPSPRVWRDYLKEVVQPTRACKKKDAQSLLKEKPVITKISFRDKRIGWLKYGFSICHESEQKQDSLFQFHLENPYYWAFNADYTLRPSCFACPAKCGKSHSDITLGDFWNVETVFSNLETQWGVSLILSSNNSLVDILKQEMTLYPAKYADAIRCVKAIVRSEKQPKLYSKFWKAYSNNGITTLFTFFEKYRYTYIQRYLKNPLKEILSPSIINFLKKIKQ